MRRLQIVAVRSQVTGQWGYCPRQALDVLRLDMDDKPTGLLTPEDAITAARKDRSIGKGARFFIREGGALGDVEVQS